jgi:hypothetical protein
VYGLVGNLGSLFVRIVLAPYEESVFQAFSRVNHGDVSAVNQLKVRARTLGVLVKLASVGGCDFRPPHALAQMPKRHLLLGGGLGGH